MLFSGILYAQHTFLIGATSGFVQSFAFNKDKTSDHLWMYQNPGSFISPFMSLGAMYQYKKVGLLADWGYKTLTYGLDPGNGFFYPRDIASAPIPDGVKIKYKGTMTSLKLLWEYYEDEERKSKWYLFTGYAFGLFKYHCKYNSPVISSQTTIRAIINKGDKKNYNELYSFGFMNRKTIGTFHNMVWGFSMDFLKKPLKEVCFFYQGNSYPDILSQRLLLSTFYLSYYLNSAMLKKIRFNSKYKLHERSKKG